MMILATLMCGNFTPSEAKSAPIFLGNCITHDLRLGCGPRPINNGWQHSGGTAICMAEGNEHASGRPGAAPACYPPGDRLTISVSSMHGILSTRSPTSLDLMWRRLYRLGFLIARCWWRLRRPQHEGALVAVHVGSALLLVLSSYRREWNFPGGTVRVGMS